MIKRFKTWLSLMTESSPRRLFGAGGRRRRKSFGVFVALLASLVIGSFVLDYTSGETGGVGEYLSELSGGKYREAELVSPDSPGGEPEQPDTTPEAAAYRAVASGLPGIGSENVVGVYRSQLDPSWASVRFDTPEDGTFFVFLQQEDDSWEARKSIRADEPESPEYEEAMLEEVPEDLVEAIYAEEDDSSGLLVEPVGSLPSVEPAGIPTPETVAGEVPEDERERVDEGLEAARSVISRYATREEGAAGVYVQDLRGDYGYGVNPDEVFFSASVIKIPIMVAVYRRIDEGEFALNDSFATASEDWAGGAGWMQWDEAGTYHTVEDYLLMMMTQSDNVATNALTRIVGGPAYVNEVSRSLDAPNTVLHQDVTSERAAVTDLDNRTTSREMASILSAVYTGRAASPESSQEMVEIMHQNNLQSSLKDGLPEGVEVANKGGWLYKVYDVAGIVWHEDRPYVIAIFSQHGSEDVEEGKALMKGLSEAVWETQDS